MKPAEFRDELSFRKIFYDKWKFWLTPWFLGKKKKRDYYRPRVSFQKNKKIVTQKTIYKCNNRCVFCVNSDCFSKDEKESPPPNTLEFQKIIDCYSKDGQSPDTIIFTCAESTLRPDIIHLLEYTMKKYPCAEIKLLTNGRMFNHKKYVERFSPLFARVVLEIPLLGPNDDIHDRLTLVRGSFAQTTQGIRNIFAVFPESKINIRILVNKQNYQHLDNTIAFIKRNFSRANNIILIYILMIGEARKNYGDLFLRFANLKAPLNSVLEKYENKAPLLLFHIPYCIVSRKFWHRNAGRTLYEKKIEFPEKCSGCVMRDKCCGFGESEFNKELFEEIAPIK